MFNYFNHNNMWIRAIGPMLFALIIFMQCIVFNWLCFHSILFSSLWTNFTEFAAYYLPKLSVALLIASFSFLLNKRWLDVVCLIIISIWMYINILYLRSYEMFLPATSMLIVSNLDGFMESLELYIHAEDLILLALPVIYSTYIILMRKYNCRRSFVGFMSMLLCAVLFNCWGLYYRYNLIALLGSYISYVNPIANATIKPYGGVTSLGYVKDFSPIHHLCRNVYELYLYAIPSSSNDVVLSKDEKLFLSGKWGGVNNNQTPIPSSSLLILLVESLEGWSITDESAPFMYWLSQNSHCLYAANVKSQQRAGMSSDGQLIVMTGLLPLRESIAVFDYPFNAYPSLAKIYDKSDSIVGIFPTPLSCWNQMYMNEAYGIKNGVVCKGDDEVIKRTLKAVEASDFVLTLTMSTHTPFKAYSDSSNLTLPSDMPKYMHDYLRSVNYIDGKIKWLFTQMENEGLLNKFTIVITGDHTILPDDVREECCRYCETNKLNYSVLNKTCPLIIYNPNQSENVTVTDDVYQMDIFPSVLSAIDCKAYRWKGLGEDLYTTFNRDSIIFSVPEIEELSDKMIKMNYFNKN